MVPGTIPLLFQDVTGLAKKLPVDALVPGFVSRVVATDIRLYLMDAAVGFFFAGFDQVRTDRQAFFCLRIDPEPAELVNMGKQVVSSELPPPF